jgi:hypothetical protein
MHTSSSTWADEVVEGALVENVLELLLKAEPANTHRSEDSGKH